MLLSLIESYMHCTCTLCMRKCTCMLHWSPSQNDIISIVHSHLSCLHYHMV